MRAILILSLLLSSFVWSGEGKELTVFAAASLTDAFKEIGKDFEKKNPGVTVTFNFGASNQLRFQLEQGAKGDVFASANTKEMDAAQKAEVVTAESVRIFAHNQLVVIVPKDNPKKIASVADLSKPGVKLVVADPAVPVGKYALEMFDALSKDPQYGADYKPAVLANVASRDENVKSVVTKIRLSTGDAGVCYSSDVTPDAAKEVTAVVVPKQYNPIAKYPIAPVKKSAQGEIAEKFVQAVVSEEGQAVLVKHGFLAPTK